MLKNLAILKKLSTEDRKNINDLNPNVRSYHVDIVKEEVTHYQPKIYDSIAKNINIQVCLGELYHCLDDYDKDSVCVNLGFLNKSPNQKEQKEISYIFEKIVVINLTNGYQVYQVSSPTKTALSTYQAMMQKDNLNKWVKYFYSPPFIKTPKVYEQYEYVLNQSIGCSNDLAILDDIFFEYAFIGSHQYTGLSKINVSRFSLDAIQQNPYIAIIAQKVSKLYLLLIDGKKYLTWKL